MRLCYATAQINICVVGKRMNMQLFHIKTSLVLAGLLMCIGCNGPDRNECKAVQEIESMIRTPITSVRDVCAVFPRTVNDIEHKTQAVITYAKQKLHELIALDHAQRTFENTARVLDTVQGCVGEIAGLLGVMNLVSPDDAIRAAAQKAEIEIKNFCVDAFVDPKLYAAFKVYYEGAAQHEQLTAEQRYYLDESMRDFKKAGLDLSLDQLEQSKKLSKEISELDIEYEKNIAEDTSSILVDRADLDGVDEHFIGMLKKTDDGKLIVGVDYPSIGAVLPHCTVADTRKRLYFAFNNRAYPSNNDVLANIIAKRDQFARILGYSSFAHWDIDGQMVGTPERAEEFMLGIAARAQAKVAQEVGLFKKHLPEGVTLDDKGRFFPWDTGYVSSFYKKNFLKIDDRVIAEYFEAEKTLQGVFDIYQKFLNLSFKLVTPEWSWSDDVRLIEVTTPGTGELCGYVFIDLYPRPNKFTHACHAGFIHTVMRETSSGKLARTPSVAVVIANFPKATADRPALLKHSDVETFFHEFGHAMHFLLASTDMSSFSGTNVKSDFVEMPSQIFEEWMFDKDLLKNLSSHYQTQKPLSDELIDTLIALKKYDSGLFLVRQCMLAMMSLDYHKAGEHKDFDAIQERYAKAFMGHLVYQPEAHFYASFGHLANAGYASKYYGYMWSKVYALDAFYQVKKEGLVNAQAGKRFIDEILGKGGSVDPNVLLKNYLGREPQSDAFFQDLGIE